MIKPLAIAFVALLARSASADGSSDCPCARNADLSAWESGGGLEFKEWGIVTSKVPLDFGETCAAHDKGRAPRCNGLIEPSWCSDTWCYVDPNDCAANIVKVESSYFDGSDLYYSYGTCSNSNSVAEWIVDGTKKMVELVSGYTGSVRYGVEDTVAGTDLSGCAVDELCVGLEPDCPDCQMRGAWTSPVDFTTVGIHVGPSGTSQGIDNAKCMANIIAEEYLQIGAKEQDADFMRVGYQYFADQATGTYTGWPKEDLHTYCDADYDPRTRPWYAAGATSPKDVVLIVDVSGSMGTADRHLLAQAAVKAVLQVLTWKDFATILLFNHGVYDKYSDVLKPVTDAERKKMTQWVDYEYLNWANGGTNFGSAFDEAWEIISKSVEAGDTSMCQKAILFMTDGVDNSFRDFNTVKEMADLYDTFVFSYALGSGADTETPKRLACENRGIFYEVPDGGDLAGVMARFYDYFVQGQQMCSPSWVEYEWNGEQFYTGCLPMYDRSSSSASLLGVTCMDVGMVEHISEMKKEDGWPHFVCQTSDMTKKCQSIQLTECDRQKLRRSYSEDSVCEENSDNDAGPDTVCQCISATCLDDDSYIDAKGYFCDTWVGDKCETAGPTWGYTAAEVEEVLSKCQRSCGKCELLPVDSCAGEQTAPEECMKVEVEEECRACRGKVSGVDIEGNLASDACGGAGLMDFASDYWSNNGPLLGLLCGACCLCCACAICCLCFAQKTQSPQPVMATLVGGPGHYSGSGSESDASSYYSRRR